VGLGFVFSATHAAFVETQNACWASSVCMQHARMRSVQPSPACEPLTDEDALQAQRKRHIGLQDALAAWLSGVRCMHGRSAWARIGMPVACMLQDSCMQSADGHCMVVLLCCMLEWNACMQLLVDD